MKAGESATLTVKVEGRGNINRIPDIKMPELKEIKVYADEPVLTTEMEVAGIRGSKTMKWALVPEKAGSCTIPPLSVSFFDAAKGQYRTVETTSLQLTVLPGKESRSEKIPIGGSEPSGLSSGKQDVKEIGHDILPAHDSIRSLGEMQGVRQRTLLSWIILIVPVVFYGFVLGFLRIKKQSLRSAHLQKVKKAAGKAIRKCGLEGSDAGVSHPDGQGLF